MKYTAEEVRAVAKRLHDDITVADGDALMASDMLTAYAERIKADARPVAQSEVVAWRRRRHAKDAWHYDQFDSIEDMAAQEMRAKGWDVELLFDRTEPVAHPTTNSPETDSKLVGGAVAQGESAWLERLKDPATVHALMLRGVIAIPSIRSMVDLRGEVPNGEEVQLLRIAELQEQLAAQPRAVPDGITALINAHAELLESNPYCYFELAYTRQTEWMAWLCSKPAEDDPDRKILACGQGNTPNEACMQALGMLAAAPSPGESNTTNQQAAR